MNASRLKRIDNKRKTLKTVLIILSLVFMVCAVLVVIRFLGFYNKIHTAAKETTVPKKEKTDYTVLLLGYGGGTHEGTYLTDTMMLANVDFKKKEVILISLPRDIWVKVPTKNDPFHTKINAVYQLGLFPKNYPDVDARYLTKDNPSGLVKKVVEDVTGLKVDGFAAVDFQGFIKAIDTLGGVDLKVDNSFTDYEYPMEGKENDLCGKDEQFNQIEKFLKPGYDEEEKKKLFSEKPELEKFVNDIKNDPVVAFPCRYETLTFTAGDTHMDGITALKYARSRHSRDDEGDFNRAKRQQLVLSAVKDKVMSINFLPKIIPLLNDLEEHINTDIPLSQINTFAFEARKSSEYKIITFVISDDYLTWDYSENGQYIVIPTNGIDNWSGIKNKISDIKLGISPTPSKVKTSPVKTINNE